MDECNAEMGWEWRRGARNSKDDCGDHEKCAGDGVELGAVGREEHDVES